MIFGFSVYGFSNTIDCVFYDTPATLTPLQQSLCDFGDLGIRLFPVGLAGIIISMIGIVIRKKEK